MQRDQGILVIGMGGSYSVVGDAPESMAAFGHRLLNPKMTEIARLAAL